MVSHENTVQELQKQLDAKQAKIDALMFEFCPEEMTAEQISKYEKSQKLVQENV